MADDPTDESRLLELAGAVSDAREVDWHALTEQTPDLRERAVLEAMQVISKVGDVARVGDPLPVDNVDSDDTHASSFGEPTHGTWGRLRIEEEVGRGSFGTVYRAWDPVLEQHVALKLLHADGAAALVDPTRGLDEARLLARVNHPGIVRVFGVESHQSRVGLWMEFIQGRTLEDILKAQGPLGADEARHIGTAVCRALAAVHKAGAIHQDVKAQNVMREDGGRIVLMDLGAGSAAARGQGERSSAAGGTPLYLAPEVSNGEPTSIASDIYSLGVLLFHLVTGTYPVEGRTHYEIQQAHAKGRRQRLRDLRPDLPADFVQAVECAVSPHPHDRFASVGELELALAGQRPSTSSRGPLVFLAAGALIATIAAAAWFASNRSAVPATSAARTSASDSSNASVTAPAITSSPATPERADVAPPSYRVKAAFYRRNGTRDELLSPGSRLALNETISLRLQTSAAVFAYVVNQDDKGVSHLLYPLEADLTRVQPFPAGEWPIPPRQEGDGWIVNSVGGREHFLVAVSPTRLLEFEDLVRDLPRPRPGAESQPRQLPAPALGTLRGLGGLAPPSPGVASPLQALVDALPLEANSEDVVGAWLRRATFENP